MKKKSFLRSLVGNVLYFVVVIAFAFLIITYVGQRTEVKGESMWMTLNDGDNLIVDKITYRFKDPERYDIIVFPAPDDPGKNYIKRIIGLPGETIQLIDNYVYINGEQVMEETQYRAEFMMDYYGTAQTEIVLGDDEYFVMGDNRNNSKDSRYEEVGNIHKDQIIGRAWLRMWPLNHFGILKHQ